MIRRRVGVVVVCSVACCVVGAEISFRTSSRFFSKKHFYFLSGRTGGTLRALHTAAVGVAPSRLGSGGGGGGLSLQPLLQSVSSNPRNPFLVPIVRSIPYFNAVVFKRDKKNNTSFQN